MEGYDENNVFGKIVSGEIPGHKVYESEDVLAILDAFPVCPGHTLVIPKAKGYASITSMPGELVGKLFAQVAVVAEAVRKAYKADGINILQNNGSASGQQVFHVHVHIVPRFKDDKLEMRFPPSAKSMIDAEAARAALEAIKAELPGAGNL